MHVRNYESEQSRKNGDWFAMHRTFFDGIEKILYWMVGTETTMVRVNDSRAGGQFALEVPDDITPIEFMTHIMSHAPAHMMRARSIPTPDGGEYGNT